MKRTLILALATAALATSMLAGSVAAKSSPDTDCLRAGIKTLQGAGLMDDAARGGVPISLALELGVTVRPGADISGISNPIPLRVVFADHRAGGDSLFIYPWCN